ncbi:MMPL family transporter [Micromonospora arborensis]|uniref:MMPL family transporter n=1 Tax=Micromonospora arborensis TaxID=2116518 RepID=UPI0033F36568
MWPRWRSAGNTAVASSPAALLILVVIGLFSVSGITFIKLIGMALLIAVLVDATIVRALLIPATMRPLGNANWWAPAPLRRFYLRHGLHESGGPRATSDRGPIPAQTPVG